MWELGVEFEDAKHEAIAVRYQLSVKTEEREIVFSITLSISTKG